MAVRTGRGPSVNSWSRKDLPLWFSAPLVSPSPPIFPPPKSAGLFRMCPAFGKRWKKATFAPPPSTAGCSGSSPAEDPSAPIIPTLPVPNCLTSTPCAGMNRSAKRSVCLLLCCRRFVIPTASLGKPILKVCSPIRFPSAGCWGIPTPHCSDRAASSPEPVRLPMAPVHR